MKLDAAKSLRACFSELLSQAAERQREVSGTMYVGAVMQHLIGAKLDLLFGPMKHNGFAVADAPSNRSGDFVVGDVVVHVTTAPTDALLRKCRSNIDSGYRPLIITTENGLGGARAFAEIASLESRVELLEFEQFLAANIHERSGFSATERGQAVLSIVSRYNEIIAICESDPSLRIEFED